MTDAAKELAKKLGLSEEQVIKAASEPSMLFRIEGMKFSQRLRVLFTGKVAEVVSHSEIKDMLRSMELALDERGVEYTAYAKVEKPVDPKQHKGSGTIGFIRENK